MADTVTNIFNKPCADIKLQINMKDDANVKTLQLFMTKLKIYDGLCKGNFGTKTQASVKKLQGTYSLGVDGWVGEQTCTKINQICAEKKWTFGTDSKTKAATSTVTSDTLDCDGEWLVKGSNGKRVELLQEMLKLLGYYVTAKDDGATLRVDGKFGTYTEEAVIDYQKANFKAKSDWDGKVGPATCKKLNAAVAAKGGLKTSSSSSDKTTTSNGKTVVKIDPNAVDPKKNIYKASQANFHIHGLHLIASEVTQTTPFSNGNWNRIELMNGSDYIYQGRRTARKYTVVCYVSHAEYKQIASELVKIQNVKCEVTGVDLNPGTYTCSVSIAYQKQTHKKLSFELIECI